MYKQGRDDSRKAKVNIKAMPHPYIFFTWGTGYMWCVNEHQILEFLILDNFGTLLNFVRHYGIRHNGIRHSGTNSICYSTLLRLAVLCVALGYLYDHKGTQRGSVGT